MWREKGESKKKYDLLEHERIDMFEKDYFIKAFIICAKSSSDEELPRGIVYLDADPLDEPELYELV